MKQYLLFAGDFYNPFGGWDDFIADFDDIEAAVECGKIDHIQDWIHVVDSKTMTIVRMEHAKRIYKNNQCMIDWTVVRRP